MTEQIITFKYDGASKDIKNHEIDVRLLAKSLDSFADLINAADEAINKRGSNAKILVRANKDNNSAFVPGSFGVELLVTVDPEVLKALGLTAAAAGGGLLSLLKRMKSPKADLIIIDEDSEVAKIVEANGDEIEAPKNVAILLDSKHVRGKIDKLIREPLEGEGLSNFSMYSGSIVNGKKSAPLVEVNDESRSKFKSPAKTQETERKERETIASIEFIVANKVSGSSGWRMKYLAHEEVAVKVMDEKFLARIRNTKGAPKIFAEKFKVKLKTVTTFKQGEIVNESYVITEVISPK